MGLFFSVKVLGFHKESEWPGGTDTAGWWGSWSHQGRCCSCMSRHQDEVSLLPRPCWAQGQGQESSPPSGKPLLRVTLGSLLLSH